MPPKVSKVSSKPTQTKTIAKANTSSSSKSSGSSKSSSSSGVKKSAPPVTSKPKNVDKVDFGKPKPTASAGVYKKPPVMKSAVTSKSAGTATVSQTTVRQSTHFGLHNEGVEPKINRVDLPMKPQKDLKPDGAHHFLEHKNEIMDKVQAPEITRKIEAMSDLSAVIPVANREFNNLAVPCQNFADACNAIDDFLATQSVQQVIKDTFSLQPFSDGIAMGSAAYNTLASEAVASVSTGTAVGAAGLAAAGAVGMSKIYSLLDNLAAHFVEARDLKQNLQQAYNMFVRATDKFNLRNSEIFELCERAGAKTDGKTITYPVDFNQLKRTFGLRG